MLNIKLPFDPASPLFDIYLKEMKTVTQTDSYIPMYTAAYSQ